MKIIDVETTEGIKKEIIYDKDDFPYDKIKYWNTGGSKKPYNYQKYVNYIEDFMTFDIETTTIIPETFKFNKNDRDNQPYAYMYLWQACIGDRVTMGRNWYDFREYLQNIANICHLNKYNRMVVYVHYLNYETQFLQSFLKIDEMFAKDIRDPVYWYSYGFEFRCSWNLTNMSLQKLCENTKKCIHSKLDGEKYNYKLIRTPKSELSQYELGYGYNDVRGLHECIEERLEKDTLGTIPLTSTGYVRRDVKTNMSKNKINRSKFVRNKLSLEQYNLCKNILRGGDNLCCRYWRDIILKNVKSYDKQSSYIEAMLTGYYPDGKFTKLDGNKETFYDYIDKYCVIARIGFIDIELVNDIPDPYIDLAHIKKYKNVVSTDGRVLKAEYIEYYLTEIDFKIIEETYNFKSYTVEEAFFCERGELPKEIKEVALKYYEEKTKLKDIEEKKYEYRKAKDSVCSIYGMMITDIMHPEITYKDGEWKKEKKISDEKKQELLNKFYKDHGGFLSYQYGIYVVAHSRKSLYDGIKLCGENLVYWDTDNIKFIDPDGEIEKELKKLNEDIIKKDMKGDIKAVAYRDGKPYYLGTWEQEPEHIYFKSLGAKKYCCIDEDREFHITVAGLNKEKGAEEIIKLNPNENPCKNFQYGIMLNDVGKTNHFYHDDIRVKKIMVNGEEIITGANVGIVEGIFTIGITNEYYENLLNIKE